MSTPYPPLQTLTVEHPPAEDPWLFAVHAVHHQPRRPAWFDGAWHHPTTQPPHPGRSCCG